MKTINDLLKRFDEEFTYIDQVDGKKRYRFDYCDPDEKAEEVKDFIVKAIKDALEACRPDIEKISEIEHEQWIKWTQTLEKTEKLSADRIKRWKEYQVPYEELMEDVKEYDRKWARKIATQYDENVKKYLGEK